MKNTTLTLIKEVIEHYDFEMDVDNLSTGDFLSMYYTMKESNEAHLQETGTKEYLWTNDELETMHSLI